jgi:hypothetical protein
MFRAIREMVREGTCDGNRKLSDNSRIVDYEGFMRITKDTDAQVVPTMRFTASSIGGRRAGELRGQ